MFVCVSFEGLRILDHVIFATVLFISATIGVYHGFVGGGPKTLEEFFMAGRSMDAYPVSLSMSASFMSAVTVLGTPVEIYRFGAMFSLFAIPYAVVVILTAETFVPVFYRLHITSTYEYLEMRFDKYLRLCGTILFIAQTASLCIFGMIGGPLLGIFSLGVLCPFANSVGTFVGLVVGFSMALWTTLGGFFYKPAATPLPLLTTRCKISVPGIAGYITGAINMTAVTKPDLNRTFIGDYWYSMTYLYLSAVGTLSTVAVGIIVSLWTGGRNQKVDKKYILTREDFLSSFSFLRSKQEEKEVLNRILSSKADEENINPAFSHIEMNTTDNKEKVEVLNRTPSSTSDEGNFYPAFSHIEMNTIDRTPSSTSDEENFYPAFSDIEMNTTDNKEKEEVLNQIQSSMSDEGNFYPGFSHIEMNATDNKEKVDGINT